MPAGETAFLVEMVEDGGMDGGEFLQVSHPPEAGHGAFSSSEGQVGIIGTIVQPAPGLLPIGVSDLLHGGAVGAQLVGDDLFRTTVTFHQFPEEFQCRLAIAALGDQGFEDLALVIDGSPHVIRLAVDLHEDLVEVPLPVRVGAHPLDPGLADIGGEQGTEPHPPKPDGFMADIDAALVQQVLDVAQRERETHVHHDRKADDLGAGSEIAKRIGFAHPGRLWRSLLECKLHRLDTTSSTFRSESGNRMYSITVKRMISALVLKQRKGLRFVMATSYVATWTRSSQFT